MIPPISTPFVLTIFGASGDLAKIKLFPSLYAIAEQKRFPKDYHIVGFARTDMTQKQFKELVSKSITDHLGRTPDPRVVATLLRHVSYVSGQYTDQAAFNDYMAYVHGLCRGKKHPHLAYFSVPPVVFRDIIKHLAKARTKKDDDIRLIIEKPFGEDKKSARKLFHFVSQYFDEEQFYLLDHYLGKSAVQSILNMRRANRVLSNIIQGTEIANIQITALESVGVEHRIDYFEHTGIVRDIIQSHLLQIFALVTMDIPTKHTAESLQREKLTMLEAIDCPCDAQNTILGQYTSYKKLEGVKEGSKTETFAAVRLMLDKQDWHGVPIYIRTGKKLHKKHTYVVIELKKFPFQKPTEEPNRVIIEFYPEPRISLTMIDFKEGVKAYQNVVTSASISCSIAGCLPEHADLLLAVMNKERLHFLSFGEIIAAWTIVDEIATNMNDGKIPVRNYADGSEGPKQIASLTKMDGFTWFDLDHAS